MTDDAPTSPFFALHPALRAAIEARGFDRLTKIQEAVLEMADAERDLRLASQTGSGKTVAIGLALASTLLAQSDEESPKDATPRPRALIITPTRELAVQVASELRWLFEEVPAVRLDSVTGGTDPQRERQRLRRAPDLLVGTPGRLLDHIRSGALRLDGVCEVILDEADQMLDMGFRDELDAIVDQLPKERRSILVSATFPRGVQHLADRFQRNPVTIDIAGSQSGASQDIEHIALVVGTHQRYDALVNTLLAAHGERALVFVGRRDEATDLAERLASEGLAALPFSGDLNQNQRTRTLSAFRSGAVRTIVATDVAARGIDVAGIGLVVHYDPPQDPAVYVHRSGRTGRAGATGRSVIFVHERGQRRARELLARARVEASWPGVPTARQLERALVKQCRRNIYQRTESEEFQITEDQMEYAKDLLARIDPATLVAHLIEMATPNYPCTPKEIVHPSSRTQRNSESRESRGDTPRKSSGNFTQYAVNWGHRAGATKSRLLAQLCRWGEVQSAQVGAIAIGADKSLIEIDDCVRAGFEERTAREDRRNPELRVRRASQEEAEHISSETPPRTPPTTRGFRGASRNAGGPDRKARPRRSGPPSGVKRRFPSASARRED